MRLVAYDIVENSDRHWEHEKRYFFCFELKHFGGKEEWLEGPSPNMQLLSRKLPRKARLTSEKVCSSKEEKQKPTEDKKPQIQSESKSEDSLSPLAKKQGKVDLLTTSAQQPSTASSGEEGEGVGIAMEESEVESDELEQDADVESDEREQDVEVETLTPRESDEDAFGFAVGDLATIDLESTTEDSILLSSVMNGEKKRLSPRLRWKWWRTPGKVLLNGRSCLENIECCLPPLLLEQDRQDLDPENPVVLSITLLERCLQCTNSNSVECVKFFHSTAALAEARLANLKCHREALSFFLNVYHTMVILFSASATPCCDCFLLSY